MAPQASLHLKVQLTGEECVNQLQSINYLWFYCNLGAHFAQVRGSTYKCLQAMERKITRQKVVTSNSAQNAVKGIALYSQNKSLQTGLLASLVSEKTGIDCQVIHELSDCSVESQLLLIDCQGHQGEELRSIVSDVNDLEGTPIAALLNAESSSEHESLLDWPCISGIFFSDTDQDQLLRGLECLVKGEYWVPRRLLHHFLEKNRRAPSTKKSEIKLTKREKQILKLIKDGATNLDISEALEVSEHTVKSHLYNVYKKIGVRNRLEASNWVRDFDEI